VGWVSEVGWGRGCRWDFTALRGISHAGGTWRIHSEKGKPWFLLSIGPMIVSLGAYAISAEGPRLSGCAGDRGDCGEE